MNRCIGLFGTCGKSKWRDGFINAYKQTGIEYFNPQVDDWKPENAITEAEHMANDGIILLPITGETYGTASLAEVGFCILNGLKLDERRDFIIMIDQNLDPELMKNEGMAKDSLRSRKIILSHLKKLNMDNVYVVKDLKNMMSISTILWNKLNYGMDAKEWWQNEFKIV